MRGVKGIDDSRDRLFDPILIKIKQNWPIRMEWNCSGTPSMSLVVESSQQKWRNSLQF